MLKSLSLLGTDPSYATLLNPNVGYGGFKKWVGEIGAKFPMYLAIKQRYKKTEGDDLGAEEWDWRSRLGDGENVERGK